MLYGIPQGQLRPSIRPVVVRNFLVSVFYRGSRSCGLDLEPPVVIAVAFINVPLDQPFSAHALAHGTFTVSQAGHFQEPPQEWYWSGPWKYATGTSCPVAIPPSRSPGNLGHRIFGRRTIDALSNDDKKNKIWRLVSFLKLTGPRDHL